MREPGLQIEWVNPALVKVHSFPDGSAIAMHHDVAETTRSLGVRRTSWSGAMERLLPVTQPLADAILAPLPPVRAPASLALTGGATGSVGRGAWPAPWRRWRSTASTATGGRARGWPARRSTPGCRWRRLRAVRL